MNLLKDSRRKIKPLDQFQLRLGLMMGQTSDKLKELFETDMEIFILE
jgi:hypothetical protein